MTLTIEQSETGSLIREVIGPNPPVFTGTIFLLTGGSVVLMFAVMVALSQISLGLSSFWSLLVAGFSVFFILIVYGIVWAGRLKAGSQIQELRDFAQKVMYQ
jgi:hypothetical protein